MVYVILHKANRESFDLDSYEKKDNKKFYREHHYIKGPNIVYLSNEIPSKLVAGGCSWKFTSLKFDESGKLCPDSLQIIVGDYFYYDIGNILDNFSSAQLDVYICMLNEGFNDKLDWAEGEFKDIVMGCYNSI